MNSKMFTQVAVGVAIVTFGTILAGYLMKTFPSGTFIDTARDGFSKGL